MSVKVFLEETSIWIVKLNKENYLHPMKEGIIPSIISLNKTKRQREEGQFCSLSLTYGIHLLPWTSNISIPVSWVFEAGAYTISLDLN